MVLAAPANVELAAAAAAADDTEGVLAQAPWPQRPPKAQLTVIRGAKDMITAMGGNVPPGADVEKFDAQMAMNLGKLLKYEKFDFKKHMLVLVTPPPKAKAGTGVEITGATMKDKKLVIHWKETAPNPAAPASNQPKLAVVEKTDAEVVLDPPAGGGDTKKPEEKKDK
jgi:hypothetical protein